MNTTGDVGLSGRKGYPGRLGSPGNRGSLGLAGDTGADGSPGYGGLPGRDSSPGRKGYPGDPGLSGADGKAGARGADGNKGQPGLEGFTPSNAPAGPPGFIGSRGDQGDKGKTGYTGTPGDEGKCGDSGLPGEVESTPEQLAGEPGEAGEAGGKGSVLNTQYAQIQTYAFHSQTNSFQACPSGMTEIMRGFSFLYFDSSSGSGHGVPLSNPGSCMATFSIQPVMECTTNTCEVKGDDSSLWMPVGDIPEDMSASEYYPQEELIFGGKENDQSDRIKQFISRCSVCESPSAVMAIHSFSSSVPSCPEKWEELWIGFSLMMIQQQEKANNPQNKY
ncbi:collagen alpha-2(IV) chain-like [Bolinopsis microptera]|uniref:collagen alpha-2(IV) chain-like n=1 Tax=Bolinopsis microptera TaxID=2820187 RepID=UPI00307AD95F